MPSRVNTKFVLFLGVTLAAVVVLLFGVWYMVISRNPAQMARQGDLYMQEANYKEAATKYGRAVRRDPGNVTYLDKYFVAMNRTLVNDYSTAMRNVDYMISAKRQKTTADINNTEYLKEYYDYLVELSRQFRGIGHYRRLQSETTVKLDSNPDNLIARKYRGIAQVHLLTDQGDAFDLPREEQTQAQSDLLATLDQNPNDIEALHHLALWELYEARYIAHRDGSDEDIQQHRASAISLSKRMIEIAPEDVRTQLNHVRVLAQAALDAKDTSADTEVWREEAMQWLAKAETSLSENPQPVDLVLNAVRLMRAMDTESAEVPDSGAKTTQGTLRAARLLALASDKHPETVDYLVELGFSFMQMQDNERAMTAFQEARSFKFNIPAIPMLRAQEKQIIAAIQIGHLLIAERVKSDDETEIAELDRRVEDIIAEITTGYGRIPALDKLEGKLRFVQGEFAKSQQLLPSNQSDVESLRLGAFASLRRGDWGDSVQRYETILKAQPQLSTIRMDLVDIYIRYKRTDDAKRHIDELLISSPDNPRVQRLHANLLATQGKIDDAIAIYESLDTTDDPTADVALARFYVMRERSDDARNLITKRFAETPDNLRLLQLLLALTEDNDQRLAYVQQARDAGVEENGLKLIEAQLNDKSITRAQLVDMAADMQNDPFANTLLAARRQVQAGEYEDAEKTLSQAAALQPDNPTVIEQRFALAVLQKQWDKAERLASRAGELNIDLANGDFFSAQLAAARGDDERAVLEYESALSKRNVFSDGWRRFGETLARLGRATQAIEALDRAVEQQPDNTAALSALARLELQAGETQDALNHTRDAWRYQPNNPSLMENYLQVEQRYGDPTKALDIRQQMVRINPANTANQRALAMLLANLDRNDEALEIIQQLLETEGATAPNVSAMAYLMQAGGQTDAGEQVLADYITEQGDEATGLDYIRLGEYRRQNGDIEGTIAAYKKATELDDPEKLEYTRVYGDLLYELGRNDEAIVVYRQIAETSPDDSKVTLRLAEALIRTGQYDEATDLISDADVEKKDLATLHMLRSSIAWPGPNEDEQVDRQQRAEALRLVNMAIQADPDNARAYLRRAVLLQGEASRLQAAINDLNKALELDPSLILARRQLVQMLLQAGRTDEATRELRQMVRNNPEDIQTRYMLVELLRSTGDTLTANALVDDALELTPDNPLWLRTKSQLAFMRGRTDEGIRALAKLIEVQPAPEFLAEYTLALLKQNRNDETLAALRDHTELVTKSPVLSSIRGRALIATGQEAQGSQVITHALNAAPNVAQFQNIVNQAIAALGPDKTTALLQGVDQADPIWVKLALSRIDMTLLRNTEALSTLESIDASATQSDPNVQVLYLRQIAATRHALGEHEAARESYEQLLELLPNDANTLNNLAYLLLEEFSDAPRAIEMAKRAAAAMPDSAEILDTLGWAQYKNNQVYEATQTLEASLLKKPLVPTYLHLAEAYHDLGRETRAQEMLTRAIDLADQSDQSAYTDEIEAVREKLRQVSAQ